MQEEIGLPASFEEFADADPRMALVADAYPAEVGLADCCSAEHADQQYVCTRPDGHDGPHVAHGGNDEAFAWWPQAAHVEVRA